MKSREKIYVSPNPRDRMLFQLLVMIPEFQRDITSLRKQFGIPSTGFDTDVAARKKIGQNSQVKNDELGFFHVMPLAHGFGEPNPNPFQVEVIRIGEKFKLPYNFYYSAVLGVAWYAVRGIIALMERNWLIEYDTHTPKRWVGIRAFSHMDKRQIRRAVSEMNKEIMNHMPEPLSADVRTRTNIENDLVIISEMIDRTEQPRKKKIYVKGNYLDIIKKQSIHLSSKKMRELEVLNKNSVKKGYTVKTWKQIGKKRGEAIKAVKKRLDPLAKKLFGYGLKEVR